MPLEKVRVNLGLYAVLRVPEMSLLVKRMPYEQEASLTPGPTFKKVGLAATAVTPAKYSKQIPGVHRQPDQRNPVSGRGLVSENK